MTTFTASIDQTLERELPAAAISPRGQSFTVV